MTKPTPATPTAAARYVVHLIAVRSTFTVMPDMRAGVASEVGLESAAAAFRGRHFRFRSLHFPPTAFRAPPCRPKPWA